MNQTSSRAQKPYLKTIKQYSNVSENRKILWKMRSSSNSHQRGVLSPPNLNEHSMNTFGRAQNCISKQSRVRCNKSKTKLVFQIVVPSNRQRFCISELIFYLMSILREPKYHFRKWVNVHRAFLNKNPIRNFQSPVIHVQIFLIPRKIWPDCFSAFKNQLKKNQH